METVLKVRLAAKREGQSVRGVARQYRLSRNTVRRYLRSEEGPPKYQRRLREQAKEYEALARTLRVQKRPR